MLKRKFKLIALLFVMISTLTLSTVRAENETENASAISEDSATVTSNEQDLETTSSSGETSAIASYENNFKKGDVYLTGNDVVVNDIIDGNLFVFANSVTINSQIGGDAFILAGTVNVGEQGYIFSNLFTCAQNVNISGVVYDLYTTAQTVSINGYIYRDIHVGTNMLNINGTIGRNAFVGANQINFAQPSEQNSEEQQVTSQGIINGDLNYSAPNEISIPEGSVSGSANYSKSTEKSSLNIKDYMISLGGFVSTAIIIWLLCLWITPKFLSNTTNIISKKLLSVIGYGLLTPIVIAVAFVILLILGITSKIALLGLSLLLLLLAISSSIFVITINRLICQKFKIEKTIGIFGMLILSSIVLWAIGLIPYVGSAINIITSLIGLGIIVTNIIPVREKTKKTKKTKKTDKIEK